MVKYNVVTAPLYSVSTTRQGCVRIISNVCRNAFEILFIQSRSFHV